jgi:hypothetical protein
LDRWNLHRFCFLLSHKQPSFIPAMNPLPPGLDEETARLRQRAAAGCCVQRRALPLPVIEQPVLGNILPEATPNQVQEHGRNVPELRIRQKRERRSASKQVQKDQFQLIVFDGKQFVGGNRKPVSEQRRKETREVRKKGACLRCQILKRSVRLNDHL